MSIESCLLQESDGGLTYEGPPVYALGVDETMAVEGLLAASYSCVLRKCAYKYACRLRMRCLAAEDKPRIAPDDMLVAPMPETADLHIPFPVETEN